MIFLQGKSKNVIYEKFRGKGKHGGTLVCHLLQDLKVSGSNLDIVGVYSWLKTESCLQVEFTNTFNCYST